MHNNADSNSNINIGNIGNTNIGNMQQQHQQQLQQQQQQRQLRQILPQPSTTNSKYKTLRSKFAINYTHPLTFTLH